MKKATSDEAMKGIFLNGLKEGRECVAQWTQPLPAGHVRLAANGGVRPLDVKPCYRVDRMIVDLRKWGPGFRSFAEGEPQMYVVSDAASGMRLCAFDVTARGKAQGVAKRDACRAADEAAKHIDAAEQGDIASVRALSNIKKASR